MNDPQFLIVMVDPQVLVHIGHGFSSGVPHKFKIIVIRKIVGWCQPIGGGMGGGGGWPRGRGPTWNLGEGPTYTLAPLEFWPDFD